MKFYDRSKTNGEEYGDWTWLGEEDVPWDTDIQGQALAELFKKNDVISIMKTRELYRHLSNAADRGDEAADIIGDILVKSQ